MGWALLVQVLSDDNDNLKQQTKDEHDECGINMTYNAEEREIQS